LLRVHLTLLPEVCSDVDQVLSHLPLPYVTFCWSQSQGITICF